MADVKTPEQATKDKDAQESQKNMPPQNSPTAGQDKSLGDANANKSSRSGKYDKDDEEEDVPIQERTPQPEDDSKKLSEKLVKAEERLQKANTKADELGVGLDKAREKRVQAHSEYNNLLAELNRRANLQLNK